jgi:hypothetical protein
MKEVSDIKDRITTKQQNFIEYLKSTQDPAVVKASIPGFSKDNPKQLSPAVKQLPRTEINQKTQIKQMMTTNGDKNYCKLCKKHFSYQFTIASHMKIVHLKIKVRAMRLKMVSGDCQNVPLRTLSAICVLTQQA